MVAKTDILIGMHGAGLTYAALMSNGAALLELVPDYWSPMKHFEKIAVANHVIYRRWTNQNESNEVETGLAL